MKLFLAALIGIVWVASSSVLAAPEGDDRFIAGYASAVLEHDFHLQPTTLTVDHGVIRLLSKDVSAADRDRIVTALKAIKGVTSVEIVDAEPASQPAANGQPAGTGQPVPANEPTPVPPGAAVESKIELHPWTLFSPTNVFQPLIADPRWPNFSAAYERYSDKKQQGYDVGSVSFGESLSLYQAPVFNGQFEIGMQAAVFALFDLDAASKDLVNADYFVGPIAEYRHGDASGFLRIFHQSSHLGDEFLLDHPGIQRVNLSYEEVDGVFSYDLFAKTLRIYGGGGYLFDRDPSDLKPWMAQYGVEYRGPRIFPSMGITPIAAVDVENRQENNWSADVSARVGLQFEDRAVLGRQVQLLLEFYDGHSPNGQFFQQRIQYVGVGLHFYL